MKRTTKRVRHSSDDDDDAVELADGFESTADDRPATNDTEKTGKSLKRKKNNKKTKNKTRPIDSIPGFKVREIEVKKIRVVGERRALQPEKVQMLKDSVSEIGLQTPITVLGHLRGPLLVAGLHRLEAAKLLGWKTIPCIFIRGGEKIARQWEIAENLHRAELTPLERSELLDEWVRLETGKFGQIVQKGRGRPGAISAAARKLQIGGRTEEAKRKNIERATNIASIAPEAKKAAREAGVDKSQSKLLKVAKEKGSKAQIEKVKELEKPSSPRRQRRPDDGKVTFQILQLEWEKAKTLRNAWEKAVPEDRDRFVADVMKHSGRPKQSRKQ